MPKKLVKWGIVAAVLVFIFAGAVFFFTDIIIETAGKQVIESYVSPILGTKVTVTDIKSSVFQGRMKIINLCVRNPQGWASGEPAVMIGSIFVEVDLKSILSGKLAVNEFLIDKLEVNFEQRADGSSNLMTIKKNVEAKFGTAKEPSPAVSEQKNTSSFKFVVKSFDLKNSRVTFSANLIGANLGTAVSISDLHVENIGEGANGQKSASLDEIIYEIIRCIVNDISKAVGNTSLSFGTDFVKDLKNAPSNIIDGVMGVFK